jgi:hypothetical protein
VSGAFKSFYPKSSTSLLRLEEIAMIELIDEQHQDGWVSAATAAAMEVFAKDGWGDPPMEVYDALAPRSGDERPAK